MRRATPSLARRNTKNEKEADRLKRKIIATLSVITLILSLCCIIYPVISDYYVRQQQDELAAEVFTDIENTNEELLESEYAAAQKYNEAILPDSDVTTTREYDTLLNIRNDGIMSFLEIPSINVSLPVYHGTSANALQRGCGHLYGSSLPTGGKGTHACISGHSAMIGKRMLTDLDQVEVGDYFYIYTLGKKLSYQVDQIKKVLPQESNDLHINPDKDFVTIITCTPYSINTHRLLVRGVRIDIKDEAVLPAPAPAPENKGVSKWTRKYIESIGVGGLCSVAVALIYFSIANRTRNREKN